MKIRCVVQVLSIDNTCVANKTLHFQCALAQDGTLTQLELLAMSVAIFFYILYIYILYIFYIFLYSTFHCT